MTQIDFLVQKNNSKQTIEDIAYAKVEQAYQNRKTVFIQTQNKAEAEAIDEMLWTQEAHSFIPHNILGEGPDKAPTIQIGYGEQCGNQHHVLINLSSEVPLFFSHFEQVFEFVPLKDELKQAARNRYRFYKERGYPLRHIEVG